MTQICKPGWSWKLTFSLPNYSLSSTEDITKSFFNYSNSLHGDVTQDKIWHSYVQLEPPPSFFPLILSDSSPISFPLPYLPDSSPIPPPSLPLWFLSSPWKPRCCWNLFTNLLIIMQTVLAIVCQPSCYIAASCHLYLQSFIGAVYTTTLILLFGLEQIAFLSELNLEHSV